MSHGEYRVFCLSMISWLVTLAVTGLALSHVAANALHAIDAPTGGGYIFVYQVLVIVVSAGLSILPLGPIYEFWKHVLLD